jgi:hypothetical protein
MKYNLQFFAEEGTGAEVTEPAEQSETVDEGVNTEATEGTESPEGAQTSPEENNGVDMNAIYAQVRRKVEAETRRKQEARDTMVAQRYRDYVNPETGRPILTESDFWEAMEAQDRVNAKKEMEDKGIDPNTLDRLIANSPRMKEAERMLEDYHRREVEQLIERDVAELNKIDPNITSFETIPLEVRQHSQANNISLVLAYKDLNFGKVTQQKESAIRQTTINQLSGKAHLAPANGVVAADTLVDIPANEYDTWQRGFPNLSALELKKKYNSFLNSQK